MGEVLDKVYIIMKDKLNQYDMEPFPGMEELRWQNTVRLARNEMVKEEFLKSDSPHGI